MNRKERARIVDLHTKVSSANKQRRQAVVVTTKAPNPTTKNLDRRIRKINNKQEVKHKDTQHTVEMISDTSTANTILVNGLSIGTTSITRIADEAYFTSIQLRGTIQTSTLNLESSPWRIIIFRDMQSNGAAPTVAQLLDLSVITSAIYAPYNTTNMKRFRVISDKRGVINPPRFSSFNTTAGDNTVDIVAIAGHKINIKRRLGFTSDYGLGNAGTIADISKNSVYILFISDRTGASDMGPTFQGGTRMYYKDD